MWREVVYLDYAQQRRYKFSLLSRQQMTSFIESCIIIFHGLARNQILYYNTVKYDFEVGSCVERVLLMTPRQWIFVESWEDHNVRLLPDPELRILDCHFQPVSK